MAVVYMSVMAPHYSTKAFYALPALTTFAACGAMGFGSLGRSARRKEALTSAGQTTEKKLEPPYVGCYGILGLVFGTLVGVWALNSFASLWVISTSSRAAFARGYSLVGERQFQEAAKALKAAVDRDSTSSDLRSLLAAALSGLGDRAGALTQARESVERNPNHGTAQLELAAELAHQGQTVEAVEPARRAKELVPGLPGAWNQLAMLVTGQGAYDEAIRTARDGLALFPFSAELRFCLGYALANRGEAGEAEKQLALACRLRPNWPMPHGALAEMLVRRGKFAEAAPHLADAGRPDQGIAAAIKARDQALAAGDKALADEEERLIERLRAKKGPQPQPLLPE
jgi:Flp pilus assembly protein TadD